MCAVQASRTWVALSSQTAQVHVQSVDLEQARVGSYPLSLRQDEHIPLDEFSGWNDQGSPIAQHGCLGCKHSFEACQDPVALELLDEGEDCIQKYDAEQRVGDVEIPSPWVEMLAKQSEPTACHEQDREKVLELTEKSEHQRSFASHLEYIGTISRQAALGFLVCEALGSACELDEQLFKWALVR